jgi:hypothetical protein
MQVVIDGHEYELTQPGAADWEWWVNAMRGEFIAAGKAAIPEDATPDEREAEMESVRNQAMKMWQPHLPSWFETVSGAARLIYRLIRPEQPDVTVAQCTEWLMAGKIGRDEAQAVMAASVPDRKDGGPHAGNGKKPAPKAGKSRWKQPTQR